uniref:Uncharacterized protein n=1 Tax=Rousettus aegyptiacus TaxID=9407 RepID=A0A7J8D6W7_ROUAE|nr:hypothetical protein HJG63_008868 [Rousettus aegyptiacus]
MICPRSLVWVELRPSKRQAEVLIPDPWEMRPHLKIGTSLCGRVKRQAKVTRRWRRGPSPDVSGVVIKRTESRRRTRTERRLPCATQTRDGRVMPDTDWNDAAASPRTPRLLEPAGSQGDGHLDFAL